MAKQAGATRYVLPSSCSIYGFQADGVVADETSPTNPLTTYARANEAAEQGVLPLADDKFCVVVLRQATVYGLSPRMRFDLAINDMTFGAWKTGKLPLMRDGKQWRPNVHVSDTARAQIFMLEADPAVVNGELFNVGSIRDTWQIGKLAEEVAACVPRDVEIEWYGDVDHRSYRVAFDKIEATGLLEHAWMEFAPVPEGLKITLVVREAPPNRAEIGAANLSDPATAADLVAAATEALGPVSILVNSASFLSAPTSTCTTPANLPARCAIRLSSQLPP